jgi:hypothetical protein
MGKNEERFERSLWRIPREIVFRLLRENGMQLKNLAMTSYISENTIRRLWGVGVSRDSLERITKALGIDPDEYAVAAKPLIAPESFYPAIGLYASKPVDLPKDGCFQDWSEEENDQSLEYLWAETDGSWIKAQTLPTRDDCEEGERRFLRLSFFNAPGAYPVNAAIHPKGMRAVVAEKKQYLIFRARLAAVDLDGGKPKHRKTGIGIAVRVCDAKLRQWEYRLSVDDYILDNIKANESESEWQEFCVEMKATSGKWQSFSMAPPREGETPDFSVITGIVFEVGPRLRKRRPESGSGTVDIDHVYLRNKPDWEDDMGTNL